MKIAAVVPTCRGFRVPEQSAAVDWYVVHDREPWEVDGRARNIVAPNPELFGQGCDSIRSAGFLAALEDGAEVILTVDDDCVIPRGWAWDHRRFLASGVPLWWTTTPNYIRPRGLPDDDGYTMTAVTHGLWSGTPDVDGETQRTLSGKALDFKPSGRFQTIGVPFPQSSMNLGFLSCVAVCMYQPAQGIGTPFDRFADIWGGLIAQRVLSLHGWGFMSGGAVVHHARASNCETNIRKEAPGKIAHETFWRHVWDFEERGGSLLATYLKLADHIGKYDLKENRWSGYFQQLRRNAWTWAEMVDRLSPSSSHAMSNPTSCGEPLGASTRLVTCPTS